MFKVTVVKSKYVPRSNYVGKGTALGNPFIMYDESQRDEVCDKYEIWFKEQIANKNPEVMAQLDTIIDFGKTFGEVKLRCFCAPKRCHANTIKKYLENLQQTEELSNGINN